MNFLLEQFESLAGLQETDILCAQTRSVNKHAANRRYVDIVHQFGPAYEKAVNQKEEKTAISRQVLEKVLSNGARFMKYDAATKTWVEMENTAIREKISHALRSQAQSRRSKRRRDGARSPTPTPSSSYDNNNSRSTSPKPSSPYYSTVDAAAAAPAPATDETLTTGAATATAATSTTNQTMSKNKRGREASILIRALSHGVLQDFVSSWTNLPSFDDGAENSSSSNNDNDNAPDSQLEPLDMTRAKSADLLMNEFVTAWAAETTAEGRRRLSTNIVTALSRGAGGDQPPSSSTSRSSLLPLDILRCLSGNIASLMEEEEENANGDHHEQQEEGEGRVETVNSDSSSSSSSLVPLDMLRCLSNSISTMIEEQQEEAVNDGGDDNNNNDNHAQLWNTVMTGDSKEFPSNDDNATSNDNDNNNNNNNRPIDVFHKSFGVARTNEFLRSWSSTTTPQAENMEAV